MLLFQLIVLLVLPFVRLKVGTIVVAGAAGINEVVDLEEVKEEEEDVVIEAEPVVAAVKSINIVKGFELDDDKLFLRRVEGFDRLVVVAVAVAAAVDLVEEDEEEEVEVVVKENKSGEGYMLLSILGVGALAGTLGSGSMR